MIYMGLTSWGQRIDKSKIESACNSIKDNPSTDLSLAGTKFREVATDLDNDKVLFLVSDGKKIDYANEIDQIGQGLIQQHEALDALLEQIKSEAATKYANESTEIQNYIDAQEAARKKAEEEKKKQEQSTQQKVYTV